MIRIGFIVGQFEFIAHISEGEILRRPVVREIWWSSIDAGAIVLTKYEGPEIGFRETGSKKWISINDLALSKYKEQVA